jgi:hypothetical protein
MATLEERQAARTESLSSDRSFHRLDTKEIRSFVTEEAEEGGPGAAILSEIPPYHPALDERVTFVHGKRGFDVLHSSVLNKVRESLCKRAFCIKNMGSVRITGGR